MLWIKFYDRLYGKPHWKVGVSPNGTRVFAGTEDL